MKIDRSRKVSPPLTDHKGYAGNHVTIWIPLGLSKGPGGLGVKGVTWPPGKKETF